MKSETFYISTSKKNEMCCRCRSKIGKGTPFLDYDYHTVGKVLQMRHCISCSEEVLKSECEALNEIAKELSSFRWTFLDKNVEMDFPDE